MKCRIYSVVEVKQWGCDMKSREHVKVDHSKHKHKKSRPELEEKFVEYERKETSSSDSNRFFKRVQNDNQGVRQEVNVTVNVEQPKDDCLTSCFSALGACFGKGAKGAAS